MRGKEVPHIPGVLNKYSIMETYEKIEKLPVVIRADLMAEGDQSGWNVLTYAAAPLTWGQDMEVPDSIL